MKNITKILSTTVIASMLLASGCSQVKPDGEQYPTDPDLFNTSIDYEDLERCSFNEDDFNSDYNDYSFRLIAQVLSAEDSDRNVMVSPASIMFAMDLASAGSNGDTLTQITDLFSEGADPLEQQAFAAGMMDRINSSEGVSFNCANSVWTNQLRMSSGLNPEYQEYIEDNFDSEAVAEEFSAETVNEINSWIDDHTSGMIDHVLDDLSPNTVAVLVNAIAFEGEWEQSYEDWQVNEMTFTTSTGDEIDVDMLCDGSEYYFENDVATGFIKEYAGGEYALLVMLPVDESISANEFLADFTVDDYNSFIASKTSEYDVYTQIPEFDYDYDTSLADALISLGVVDAFDENLADFTGIGVADSGNNIFISQVLHNTHIELDREGTRAAAATTIVMEDAAVAPGVINEARYVYCNRPFAYAIVDTETMNPMFIGTYNG
ncbi:MAG: serpin family protein [Saccharofermentans sp.]|nr:serpin family protein [Saccharofermentans sp.]